MNDVLIELLVIHGAVNKFPHIFVQEFKIVVDS